MPGKNPAEAVEEYLIPIRRSMSCFSKAVVRSDGYDPDVIHTVTFREPTVELITNSEEILALSFVQSFELDKALFGWKVCTRSYWYEIDDDQGREILAFHWHPNGSSSEDKPHLHISDGAARNLRSEIRDMHFPTPRISFEEFALMLIEDFGVIPDKEDSIPTLNENLARFNGKKTWG
ncbi:MAG TPA: hypothetical protein VNX17_12750 [Edaphobacter sp.]|nr:hypothetical protein [Edaphobacter sp.]